jgi:primary-amine oxidase
MLQNPHAKTEATGRIRLTVRFLLCCLTALLACSHACAHPLDPLSRDELAAAMAILRTEHRVTESTRVPLLSLKEPPKTDILAGRTPPRQAFAVLYERATKQTFEAVVDLSARRVISWQEVKGVQPPLMLEDFALAEQIVKADAAWRAAIARRGITDLDRVQVDGWGAGYSGIAGEELHRSVRSVFYYRGNEKSAYFHPVEGLVAFVDLDARKIERLLDTGALPLAKPPVLADPAHDYTLKPVNISQPEGTNFRVDGHEISCDHWRFRYSFHPREGLVLYSVGYLDHGKLRPVMYRGSLAEMVVPYGDPSPAWAFRNAFDISEYAFTARSIFPMTLGADVPANASFLNADFADESGRPYNSQRAAALYERDGGVLWRYADLETGKPLTRRARDLVLATFMSAPPYEYGFHWIFHQDGRLEMSVTLTGIMTTKTVPAAQTHEEHGHRVAPELEAVHHQHFFNFRLDMDIDGPANSIVEMNTMPAQQGDKAIMTMDTPLRSELQAKRQVNQASTRVWRIFNPNAKNALGSPTGYLLIPGENSPPYASPTSWIRKRAGFLDSQLWVTPFDPAQQYPAGNYVYQSKGGEGLPAWTRRNRSLESQDLVLWYTLGITHIPRPEEWPVMPVHEAGFQLAPSGFFRSNPALSDTDIK